MNLSIYICYLVFILLSSLVRILFVKSVVLFVV